MSKKHRINRQSLIKTGNPEDAVILKTTPMSGSTPYKVTKAEPSTDQERYKENLKIISSKNPEVSSQLESLVMTNIQLTATMSGRTSGLIWDVVNQGWVQIHNNEDPVAEAIRDVDAMYSADKKIFIILGSGLGYLIEELAKRLRPYQRMAVFEKNPALFKAAMYACNLSNALGDKRVDTFIGDSIINQMEQWFLGFQSHEKFHIAPPIRSGYTGTYDKDFYDALTNKAIDMLRYHAVGLATWQQFGSAIGNNDVDNIPEYFTSPGLNSLHNAWEGKPAICVAAGPSLKKNLKYLLDPEVRNRVCVLAVGTVYGLLRSMGIIPDIVTSIDFQRLNWTDQFRLFPQDKRSSLVYLHSVYPQIPRRWPGPKFVARNSSDTTEWLYQYDEPKMSAGQVQTVAHLNVVAAIEMGCSPIILLGQDLSMPPNEHHAPGAMAQDTTPSEAPDSCIEAIDIYGNIVQTRHSFLSMRTVFAKMFLDHPDRQFVNCTEGGIHIDGAVDLTLHDAIRQIVAGIAPQTSSASSAISSIYDSYKTKARLVDFESDVTKTLEDLLRLKNLGSECLLLSVNDYNDIDKRQHIMDTVGAFENLANTSQTAMAMVCVRSYEIVHALSEIEPNGDGVTNEELAKYRMSRTLKICKVVNEEYAAISRNLRTMLNRVHDISETLHGGIRHVSHTDIKRKLARQSYFSVECDLQDMIQEYGDSLYFQNDMRRYLWLRARLAFHLQEFQKSLHIANAHNIDPKMQARCQGYIDRFQSRMVPYIVPYLYTEPVKNINPQKLPGDLC
jgi:hypothetical protein